MQPGIVSNPIRFRSSVLVSLTLVLAALSGCERATPGQASSPAPTVTAEPPRPGPKPTSAGGSPSASASVSATTPAPAAATKLVLGKGDVILRGTIDREKTPTTQNDDLVAGKGAILSIELRAYKGTDAAAPLVFAEVAPLAEGPVTFPIEYELRGDRSKLGAPGTKLMLSARIASGTGGKGPTEMRTESRNDLDAAATQASFVMSGIEKCGSPGSGGYCN